jgi:hypothetical protein
MFKLTTTATALVPSGSAMPACGHAWLDTTGVIATGVVRDRQEGSVRKAVLGAAVIGKRDAVRTQAYFPGTTAWSPPIC